RDSHLQALQHQERALEEQAAEIRWRHRAPVNDPDIGVIYVPTDETDDALEPVLSALRATRAQLAPAMDKIQRLKDEVREANEVMRTASGDYERWLDIEHEHRLDQIFTEEPPFTRACRYDGHPILVALGKEFCGDECRSKYRQFDGVWFPQCETCGRYF